MKSIGIIILVGIVMLLSCSSVDIHKSRYTKFNSNLDIESFFSFTTDVLKNDGFKILESNISQGTIQASKDLSDGSKIDFNIEYFSESKDVVVVITNLRKHGNHHHLEYYNDVEYNENYKNDFYVTLLSIRSNATKTAFPNR
jgi:hypothetical protein